MLEQLVREAYKCAGWHIYPTEKPASAELIIYQDKEPKSCGIESFLAPHKSPIFAWKSLAHVPFHQTYPLDNLLKWFQYEQTKNPRIT